MLEIARAMHAARLGVPLFHVYSEGRTRDFPLLRALHQGRKAGSEGTTGASRQLQRRLVRLHRAVWRFLRAASDRFLQTPKGRLEGELQEDEGAEDGGPAAGEDAEQPDVPTVELKWHLNEDLRSTIAGMLYSDILVMGHSSLSYIAALYRGGGNASAGGDPPLLHRCLADAKATPLAAAGRTVKTAVAPAEGRQHADEVDEVEGAADSHTHTSRSAHCAQLRAEGRSGSARGEAAGAGAGAACWSGRWATGITLYSDHFQVPMPHWLRYRGPGSFSKALLQRHAVCRLQSVVQMRQCSGLC